MGTTVADGGIPQYKTLAALRTAGHDFNEAEETVLRHVNDSVAAGETLGDILDFVFEKTQTIMPCDRIGCAFLDEDQTRVVAHWARATYEPLLLSRGYGADLKGSTLQAVLANDTVRIINDLEAYFARHPDSHSTALLLKEGVRSSMTCPLTVEGRHVGLLFRSSQRAEAYTSHEASLHAAMADRIAQAVEKAWRIEVLARANRSYAEMLRFVSHELKSPIASVIMQSRALLDGMFGETSPAQTETLEAILERGEHLLNLTNDYLDLARFEGGHVVVNKAEPRDYISCVCEPVVRSLRPLMEERRVTFTHDWPEAPIMASFDPTLMKIALTNLISNAVKYGNSPGRVRLHVKLLDARVHVTVWNAGPGFPEEMRGFLFRKFSRLAKPELVQRPGTGVGLYVVSEILRLHEGATDARSRDGAWAEFILNFPTALPDPDA